MQDPIRVLIRHADALIGAGVAVTLAGRPGVAVVAAMPGADMRVADYDGALAWLAHAPPPRAAVLVIAALDLPNKRIASRLAIALGTVKAHIQAIRAKLEARSRTEARVIAEQRGLLGPRLALAA